MKRADKAARIMAILDEIHPAPPIPLVAPDPYTFLLAVLLSAQCTDKRVNEVSPRLFARASNPADMVKLDVAEIEDIIRPCGLAPAKAKNISALSHQLLEDYGGVVPDDLAELEKLPGVGHKTASVVVCQAFGKPAFPVDTHIHRLANRWGLTRSKKNVAKTERDLKKVFPEESWAKLHLQIIYFGRSHCPALYHDLASCPICGWAATKKQIAAEKKANADLKKKAKKTREANKKKR